MGKAHAAPGRESRGEEAVSILESRRPAPYVNPYLAGFGLGPVLLAAFVVMGRGLGASGAFASTAAGATAMISPAKAQSSALLAGYVSADAGAWTDWLIFEIVGVAIGGAASAWLAGRLRCSPNASAPTLLSAPCVHRSVWRTTTTMSIERSTSFAIYFARARSASRAWMISGDTVATFCTWATSLLSRS